MADNVPVRAITARDAWNAAINSPTLSVVLFSAPWCAGCKELKPKYKALPKLASGVRFYDVNSDKGIGEELADSLQVDALPTVMFFKSGKQLASMLAPSPGSILAKCNDL